MDHYNHIANTTDSNHDRGNASGRFFNGGGSDMDTNCSLNICQKNSNISFSNNKIPFSNNKIPFSNNKIPFSNNKIPFSNIKICFSNKKIPFSNKKIPFSNKKIPFSNNKICFSFSHHSKSNSCYGDGSFQNAHPSPLYSKPSSNIIK